MRLAGKRIGLLIASASRAGGGVFEAVVRQAALIASAGGEPRVIALRDAFSEADRGRFGDTPVQHLPVLGPAQIGFAPGLIGALKAADLDLLHLHGIWMYPSHAGAVWARATGRPYVVSPHGMLDPWIVARGRAKKALARAGYERRSWRRAAVLHALTDDEAADIARETGRAAVVVPNAAPPTGPGRDERRGVLYLGRLHAKKNLAALIEGWRLADTGDAVLTIAGWGDAAEVALAKAAAGPDIRFAGAVHGADKDRLLAAARWSILPSLSEGLPMAVLEAWAAGTPALMTQACHLPEGFAAGAALPCGETPTAIAAALTRALAVDDDAWRRHSAAAQALATGPFGAATIAGRWADVYAGLLQ